MIRTDSPMMERVIGEPSIKGTVSLFWPRGPEVALTFLSNELNFKIRKWGRVMEEMKKFPVTF